MARSIAGFLVLSLFAAPAVTKFPYHCAGRPLAHPYFGRAALIGVCDFDLPNADGTTTKLHEEAPNTLWALWKVANDACYGLHHEIVGLEYRCEWKPTTAK